VRLRVLSIGFAGLGLIATVAACEAVLGGFDRPKEFVPNADAALPDAAADAGPLVDLCAHKTVPPVPVDDDPATQLPPMWFAVRDTFLAKDDAGVAGYDLDGVCSCFADGHTAYDAGPSCTPPHATAANCDQAGGIDNQLAAVKGASGSISDDLDKAARYTQYANEGGRAVLVYLQGYNGKPNDSEVTLGFAPADGIYNLPGCGAVLDPADAGITGDPFQFRYPGAVPDGGRVTLSLVEPDGGILNTAGGYKPLWDGCDPWVPKPGTVAGGVKPGEQPVPINVQSAYVNNYEVIATGQPAAKTFFGGTILELSQPITSAKLEPLPDAPDGTKRFRISRIVTAGRASFRSLLALAGPVQLNGAPLCSNPILYASFAQTACQNQDVSISRSLDFRAGTMCDAFSLAGAANAEPVIVDVAVPAYVNPSDDGAKCIDAGLPKLGPNCELLP